MDAAGSDLVFTTNQSTGTLTVASVIAGATKPEQIEANVAAATWNLSDADRAEVDAVIAG